MSAIRRVVVVTKHYHYEGGDVIAVFKRQKQAIKYVEGLTDVKQYIRKDRDDGCIEFNDRHDLESYEIKTFKVEES